MNENTYISNENMEKTLIDINIPNSITWAVEEMKKGHKLQCEDFIFSIDSKNMIQGTHIKDSSLKANISSSFWIESKKWKIYKEPKKSVWDTRMSYGKLYKDMREEDYNFFDDASMNCEKTENVIYKHEDVKEACKNVYEFISDLNFNDVKSNPMHYLGGIMDKIVEEFGEEIIDEN